MIRTVFGILLAAGCVHGHAEDRFVSGGSAHVGGAAVSGDLIAAGGLLRLDAAAAQDLYAAGGRIELDGAVARNARIAGGSVAVGPKARIDGNASLAGGRVQMRGAVGGYLQAAGGRVLIDGPVNGDVEAAAGEVELGPQARIGGRLRYRSEEPLRMHPAAQVQGGVERLEMPRLDGDLPRAAAAAAAAAFGIWVLGLMLFAAVLVWGLPGFTARVTGAARQRPGPSLLAGFVALVMIPATVFVLLLTLIGVPLAALGVLAYLALLLVGYVAAGIALGDAVLVRWQKARAPRTGWRAAAAALGVLVIGLAALVPWLGALVAFLALLAGMGALLLALRGPGRAAL